MRSFSEENPNSQDHVILDYGFIILLEASARNYYSVSSSVVWWLNFQLEYILSY